MNKQLTDIQKNILDFIIEKRYGVGIPPSMAEIAEHFGYKNRSTVQQHLQALEKKGYIKRRDNISRGIELCTQEQMFVSKPVYGEVAAGNPLTVYPNAIDMVELPTIARMPPDAFLLRVKGDSLKDAYIFSGDIVIVNPNIPAVNGHFVAAIVDDGAVVKRFYRRSDRIELLSENPEYRPIIIPSNHTGFRLVGVVVGVYRSLDRRA